MIFVGIDPGLSGAVGIITENAGLVVFDTPVVAAKKGHEYIVPAMSGLLVGCGHNVRAALETAIAMPRQSSATTLKQGRGVGIWEGILAALGIPYELVAPRTWKSSIGLPVGAEKGESRALAARLFPASADYFARVKDDGRAEAALLAEWGRRRG